jgi:hypothetical protein
LYSANRGCTVAKSFNKSDEPFQNTEHQEFPSNIKSYVFDGALKIQKVLAFLLVYRPYSFFKSVLKNQFSKSSLVDADICLPVCSDVSWCGGEQRWRS